MQWGAGRLLRGSGATANPVEVDEFNIFNRYRTIVSWASLDGFVTGGDTGAVFQSLGFEVRLRTGTVLNDDVFIRSLGMVHHLSVHGKGTTVEFVLTDLSFNTDQTIWWRFELTYSDPPSETVQHFGWKIINNQLFASNANGTAQVITDTGVLLAAGKQMTGLKIVFIQGTNCRFFVNDILRVTHTTNLPSAANYLFTHHLRTAIATFREIKLGRILVEREH